MPAAACRWCSGPADVCAGETDATWNKLYGVDCGRFGIRMLCVLSDARSWLVGFRSRPVVLSSPYPVSECFRRLATVTTQHGVTSWYLNPRTAGRPTARLRGDVGPSRVNVARFEDAAGRNSFAPWLDARLERAAGGGTTLTGSIGLHPAVRALIPVIAGIGSLLAVAAVAGGIALLVHGHLSGLLPAMLIPLAITTFIVGFNVAGLRLLERDIPQLIQELNGLLGSTATFTVPAASGDVA